MLNSRARCISLASKRHTRSIRGRGLFGGHELFEEIRYIYIYIYIRIRTVHIHGLLADTPDSGHLPYNGQCAMYKLSFL